MRTTCLYTNNIPISIRIDLTTILYYTNLLSTIYIHLVNGTDRIIDTYMLFQDPKFMGDQTQQLKIFNRLYIVVLVV